MYQFKCGIVQRVKDLFQLLQVEISVFVMYILENNKILEEPIGQNVLRRKFSNSVTVTSKIEEI